VGAVLALVYGLTAAGHVQTLDCGELTATAHTWGVPHPPGFPSYVLVAGLFARLSPGSTAFDLALLSALAGAGAAALLCLLMLRLGVRPIAACLAACAWALLAPTWRHHGEQEVFALTHLSMAGLLVLAWELARSPRRSLAFALGALSGVAAGVHSTVVLTAPALIVALLLHPGSRDPATGRLAWGRLLRTVGLAAAGLPLGLATHAYLLGAARWGGLPSWGALAGLGELVDHVLRREYGTLSLGLGVHASPWVAVARYLRHLAADGLGLLPVAGLIGSAALARRAWRARFGDSRSGDPGPRRATRGGAGSRRAQAFCGALVLCWVVGAGPFLLAFRTPPTAWWQEVISRFFPLVTLLGLPLVGLGLETLLRLGRLPLQRSTQALAIAWLALVAAGAAGQAVSRGRAVVPRLADDLLASVEPGGILLTSTDTGTAALWEARHARGLRPDVVHVVPSLLPAPWHAAQVELATGGFKQPPRRAGIAGLVRWSLAQGRALYLDAMPASGLPSEVRVEPSGVALRLVPRTQPLLPPAEVERRLADFYVRRQVDPNLPLGLSYRHSEVEALRRYAAPWQALAAAFDQLGDQAGAARCAKWVDALQPWLR